MEHECSVCMGAVDPEAALGEPDSGGYVPVQFPNEPAVEVWLHHRCLVNNGKELRPLDGRVMLEHADPHPMPAGPGTAEAT